MSERRGRPLTVLGTWLMVCAVVVSLWLIGLSPWRVAAHAAESKIEHVIAVEQMSATVYRYSFDDGVDCYLIGTALSCVHRE